MTTIPTSTRLTKRNKLVLIGSQALKAHGLLNREPYDWDFIVLEYPITSAWTRSSGNNRCYSTRDANGRIEITFGKDGNSDSIFYNNVDHSNVVETPYGPATLPTLEELYLLKLAHLVSDYNWYKHVQDMWILQEAIGESFESIILQKPWYNYFFKLRRAETLKRVNHKTPRLKNTDSKEFFTDNVTYHFVHDDVHKVVALEKEPAYKRILKTEGSVECSKKKFEALPFKHQLACVVEECMVIALERFIIPANLGHVPFVSEQMAYMKSLCKICTTLTSGWFRSFALQHSKAASKFNTGFTKIWLDAWLSGKLTLVQS